MARKNTESTAEYDPILTMEQGQPFEDTEKAPGSSDETKKRKTVEQKRADFARLASRRVSNALDAISSLRHLSSPASYEWDQEQQDKIFETLRRSLSAIEESFNSAKAAQQSGQKTSRVLSFTL